MSNISISDSNRANKIILQCLQSGSGAGDNIQDVPDEGVKLGRDRRIIKI